MATKKSSSIKKVTSTKPVSRNQQIANITKQAQALQSKLNAGVKAGTIKSGGSSTTKITTPTPPKIATPTRDQQISNLSSQAQALQNELNRSVQSGQIQGGQVVNNRVVASPKPVIPQPQTIIPPQNQSTVPTPINTTSPATTSADTYYNQLVSSMQPTAEENALQAQQTALDAQMRNLEQGQGVMNRNIADQPIALPFVTGQQSAVEQRYALQRGDVQNRQQTLQEKLANLQKKRQSAMDISKYGLEYAQAKQARADQQAQQQYENNFRQQQFDAQQNQITSKAQAALDKQIVKQTQKISTGNDFINMKTSVLKDRTKKMFAPAFSTKLINSLNDEQLRLFMNDYTETQNQMQQSIEPSIYLEQWKQAAGIGTKDTMQNPFAN